MTIEQQANQIRELRNALKNAAISSKEFTEGCKRLGEAIGNMKLMGKTLPPRFSNPPVIKQSWIRCGHCGTSYKDLPEDNCRNCGAPL